MPSEALKQLVYELEGGKRGGRVVSALDVPAEGLQKCSEALFSF